MPITDPEKLRIALEHNTDSTTRYVENVEQETHQEQKNAEDVKART